MDNRILQLAKVLVEYSCDVQKGERVLVNYDGDSAKPLVKQVIKEIYIRGGLPYVDIKDSSVSREILLGCTEEQLEFLSEYQMTLMKGMQAYIGIRASENASEHADIPTSQQNLYSKVLQPVLRYRVEIGRAHV